MKAKDLRTGQCVAKSMCWRKPNDLTEIQAKKELQRVCLDFEDEFKKQLNGMLALDNDITFIDYANKWLEKIKNTRSLNYYIKGKDNIRKFDAYFGNIKLN